MVLAQWDKGTAGADLWFKSVPSTKTSGEVLINCCTFNFTILHRCWRVVGCAIETDDVPDSILAPQEPNIMDCTYPSHLLYAAFLCILTKCNISVHFNERIFQFIAVQCNTIYHTMQRILWNCTSVPCGRWHSAVFLLPSSYCHFLHFRLSPMRIPAEYLQPSWHPFEHIEQTSCKDVVHIAMERMCYFVRLTVSSTLYN